MHRSIFNPNVLPLRALNWVGRFDEMTVLDRSRFTPQAPSNDIVVMNYEIINGQVSEKLKRQRTDYNAIIFRGNSNDIKEDAYLEKLEK
jgi:hypothetical protein